MKSVQPKTFLVGATEINWLGMHDYLEHVGCTEFVEDLQEAREQGLSELEMLSSFYAKLCYKSLTVGNNDNISRVRSIEGNVKGTLGHAHGAVFEHCWFNFVTTDCSRVFTHELVRHRVGTAFSQTSGRYVRSDQLDMVLDDPILDQRIENWHIADTVRDALVYAARNLEEHYRALVGKIDWDSMDMAEKKKLTSALRRVLPNGQANEIGWSANLRTLRHLIQLRTNRHAEWEIRMVFGEVFELVREWCPLMFHDAQVEIVDGLPEVTAMKTQPYDNS